MSKRDIVILDAEIRVGDIALSQFPKGETESYVRRVLVDELANHILKNFDTIPIEITQNEDLTYRGNVYRITLNMVSDEVLRRIPKEKKRVLRNYSTEEAIRILFPNKRKYYRLNKINPALCVHAKKIRCASFEPFERVSSAETTKEVIPLIHVRSLPTQQDIFVGICPVCNNLYYYVDSDVITMIEEE